MCPRVLWLAAVFYYNLTDKRLSKTVRHLLSLGALKLTNVTVAHAAELEAVLVSASHVVVQLCLFVRGLKIDASTIDKVR